MGAEPQPPEAAPPTAGPPMRRWLPIALFFTTCATTFAAGSQSGGDAFSVRDGLIFMCGIMGILLVHEMGHYVAARRNQVDASLPYFLPLPLPPIGTLGAIIRMRQVPRTRSALLDIGAAGPLAGLLVAVPVCLVGLWLSPVQPLSALPAGAVLEGNSLLYLLLKHLAHPELGPGDDVLLHPLAWAGWIGLLVTSLNLLPAGQLDGGHVAYALAGERRAQRLSKFVRAAVFALGLVGAACQVVLLWPAALEAARAAGLEGTVLRGSGAVGWLVWSVLLHLVGRRHPPPSESERGLGPARRATGVIALAVLVLTFTPVFLSPVTP